MKYLPLLLLASCGIDVHVKTDPVIVKYTIDMSLIEPICKDFCKNDVDPVTCSATCVNKFLLTLAGISVK